jgi:hypothetical protein
MEVKLGGLARKQDVFEDSRDFDKSFKMTQSLSFHLGIVSLIVEQNIGREWSALLAPAKITRRHIHFALKRAGKVCAIREANRLCDLCNGLICVS